eukprot:tig00000821_g4513.t1
MAGPTRILADGTVVRGDAAPSAAAAAGPRTLSGNPAPAPDAAAPAPVEERQAAAQYAIPIQYAPGGPAGPNAPPPGVAMGIPVAGTYGYGMNPYGRMYDDDDGGGVAIDVCGEQMPVGSLQPHQWCCLCCCPCFIGNPCSPARKERYKEIAKSFIGIVSMIEIVLFIACLVHGGFASQKENRMLGPPTSTLLLFGASNGVLEGAPNYQLWRPFTAVFLHGGVLHLFFNVLGQVLFGRQIEMEWGAPRAAAVFLIGGVCGNLGSAAWHPSIVSVGASGAVLALAGAMVARLTIDVSRDGTSTPASKMKIMQLALFMLLIFVMATGSNAATTVDNAAHLCGAAAGLLLGLLLFGGEAVREGSSPAWGRALRAASAALLAAGVGSAAYFVVLGGRA